MGSSHQIIKCVHEEDIYYFAEPLPDGIEIYENWETGQSKSILHSVNRKTFKCNLVTSFIKVISRMNSNNIWWRAADQYTIHKKKLTEGCTESKS